MWWATYYVDGKNVRATTRVHVHPTAGDSGLTVRDLKKLAQAAADNLEGINKGAISARLAVAAIKAAAAGVGYGGMPVPRCKEYASTWLKTEAVKKKSFAIAKKAVERWLQLSGEEIASLPLDRYTPAMGKDYIEKALDEVSGSTVNRDREEICAMFNRAVAEQLIDINPLKGVRVPHWAMRETQERRPFTPDELRVILTKFPSEWRDMVAVCMLLGGQRLGDIATLKWDQVEMDQGLVRLTTAKTNRGMRKPIVPLLRGILLRRKMSPMGSMPHIFPYAAARYNEAGGKSSKLSIEFGNLLKQHGIGQSSHNVSRAKRGHVMCEVGFHSLRSTTTTFLLEQGVPSEMVRHIVGHDDPEIERRHYTKFSAASEAANLAKLEEWLNVTWQDK